ncbi:MAG: roadblock/LC7 domain-containing protein [Chloroflexi bacterium]|nr:roadblock/LC7 domain-containing protein [Chloroflexota bacterium]
MAEELKNILAKFQVGEDDLVAVVSPDGLPIESVGGSGIDVDGLCAVASDALRMAEAIGGEISKGDARQTMIEYDGALMTIGALSDDALLVVLSLGDANLGRVRFLAKKYRQELAEGLQAI